MNKRIRELCEKTIEELGHDPIRIMDRFEMLCPGFTEKFTKLIIQKCVKVCSGVEEDGELNPELGTFVDGALLCREEIKSYFGVEE